MGKMAEIWFEYTDDDGEVVAHAIQLTQDQEEDLVDGLKKISGRRGRILYFMSDTMKGEDEQREEHDDAGDVFRMFRQELDEWYDEGTSFGNDTITILLNQYVYDTKEDLVNDFWDRLVLGKNKYGALNVDLDTRDWKKERREELLDALVYEMFELVREANQTQQ